MSLAPPFAGPDVLDGWKAIADHLGKSVRTAQRWSQESGLPVHKLGSGPREHVYAFRSEIDDWRRTAGRLIGRSNGMNGAGAGAPSGEASGEPEGDGQTGLPVAQDDVPRRRSRWPLAAALGGLALVIVAAAGASACCWPA